MKKIISLVLMISLSSCANLNVKKASYGEYRLNCFWFSCATIELSESRLVESYDSDDPSDSMWNPLHYTIDGNFLKIDGSNRYYYLYSSSNWFGLFGTYFLASETVYTECKGIKSCMQPRSYRLARR